MKTDRARLVRSLLLALASCSPVWADITAWNTTTGLWDVSVNWTAGVPSTLTDFEVSNGGTAQIDTGILGSAFGGTLGWSGGQSGGLTLGGTGSLSLASEFWIGNSGTGTLTMTGGTLSNTIGNIARGSGSTGTVTVSGGTWTNTQLLVVGNEGTGTLTLSGTAAISAPTVELGRQAGGVGTLNLDGGVLSTGNLVESGGGGTVNFNGGTLRLTGDQSDLFSGFEAGDITLQSGGAILDTNGRNVATSYALDGAGGLVKRGAGTLTLAAANTYAGATTIEAGRLVAEGSLAASTVTVADGATFSPGSGASTITLGGLVLNDYSRLDFQLGAPDVVGGGVNDLITVNGPLTLGGFADITALDGFGAGTYRLIDYTGSLTNNGLLFGIVPAGYDYAVGTATAGQVNLSVTAGTAQYWDGAHLTPQGTPGGSGGSGVWAARNTNWTNAGGNGNSNWTGALNGVFGGTGGTVTIADGYEPRVSRLTFLSDGYTLAATGSGGLVLTGNSFFDVQSTAATITAPTFGSGTLVKQGPGTLTLANTNSHYGGTTIHNGTLKLTGVIDHPYAYAIVGSESGNDATLLIEGGTLYNRLLYIANAAGSTGRVIMTGGTLGQEVPQSSIFVGAGGTGSLTVTGGTVYHQNAVIGSSAGAIATLKIGGDANWRSGANGSMSIGGTGSTGSLEISGNATITSVRPTRFYVGGDANVYNPTSAGHGTVTMTGGTFNYYLAGATIGYYGTGSFTMSGGNTTFSALTIGGLGTGIFDLQGGTMTSRYSTVGIGTNGIGTATVSGGTWTNAGELRVGDGSSFGTGTGTVTLSGGTITNTVGYIGTVAGATGTVTASGGTWTNSQLLVVGNEGTGSVTISGTAAVSAPETSVGRLSTGVGTLTLNGGTLTTGSFAEGTGSGTVVINGGTLKLTGNQSALFGGFETGDVTFAAGGATIDTQGFAVAAVADIGGAGGLTKLGTGTLTLSGANSYAGATTVTAGGLKVNGSLAGAVALADGTTLGGGGSIAGAVTLGANVTLNPGDGVGTLTTGDLALNSTSILNFDLATPAASDLIAVNGALTLDGTLNIANLTGFGEGVYRLFDYIGALTDNGLLFGILPGGFDLTLSTTTGNQVNLLVSAALVQYWDGSHTAPQGSPGGSGGTGTWSAATTNWTNTGGNANSAWLGTVGAVFGGTGGTVAIADGFTANTPSLSFRTDGYTLAANGTGALALTSGGLVEVQTGAATISAPVTGTATLVKQGDGTLNLTGANTYSGGTDVRDGTLAVTGSGSIAHTSGDLAVGRYAGDDAALQISGTASVSNATGFLGADAGSTGHATISGGTWTNAGELRVGDFGTGTLTITGGAISSTIGNIARSVGSTGTVTMSGGTWTNSVEFLVGNAGQGTLTFSGGTISSVHSIIGAGTGNTGTATMSGGTWTNSGELRVGDFGTGSFTFNDGTITDTIGNIGRSAGGKGTVTMNGGTWTNSAEFLVGNAGTGAFTLTGGTLSSVLSTLGAGNVASGTATISGGTWTSSSELRVGDFGAGTLTLSAGAIANTLGNIGRSSGSTGTVTVSGGTWTNTTGLNVGNAGNGTLTLEGAGVVNVVSGTGTVYVAAGAGSTGTLNFGAYDQAHPTTAGTLSATAIAFGAGEGVVNFNQTNTFTLAAVISGDGSVVQRGTGTTILTGANTYTGPTTVESGTLRVDGSITSNVTVNSGATFGGGGSSGDILLESGATLRPVGSFDAGSLTWNPGATLVFSLGDGTNDSLSLTGEFSKGTDGTGTYQFTFLDAGWVAGQTYTLVSFVGSSFEADDFGFTNGGGFTGTFGLTGNSLTFQVGAVPEPSTFAALAGLVALGLGVCRRRRRV